jgi:hypothetical protein
MLIVSHLIMFSPPVQNAGTLALAILNPPPVPTKGGGQRSIPLVNSLKLFKVNTPKMDKVQKNSLQASVGQF